MKQLFASIFVAAFLNLLLISNAFTDINCLDEFARLVNIDALSSTDPSLLKEIFENEMHLGDFKILADKFVPHFTESQPLESLLAQVKKGITSNHPAIVEFLCQGFKKNIFLNAAAYQPRVRQMVHHTFLLNLIVEEIVADSEVMKLIYNYFISKRALLGVSESFSISSAYTIYSSTYNTFETMEMLTTDLSFSHYIDFRSKEQLGLRELLNKNTDLFTHMMEASATDRVAGFINNSHVGAVLANTLVKELWIDRESGLVKQRFIKGWTELFQTWNLAFITGNLTELDLVYPQLLIPTVLNASSDDYLYRQGIALWLTTNIVLLHKLKHTPRESLGPFPEAASLWGRINFLMSDEVYKASGGKRGWGEYILNKMAEKMSWLMSLIHLN